MSLVFSAPFMLITFAGIPATTLFDGISWVTTALAPTNTLSPRVTEPNILLPGPSTQLSPIEGIPALSPPHFQGCCYAMKYGAITSYLSGSIYDNTWKMIKT